MKKIFAAIFVALISGFIFAQVGNIERAVRVKTSEKDAVRVYEVERSEEKIGNYSAVTIEYMIENRTSRILEGEFEFPLQDGENVAGFALDINGKMRDAVAVEKEKGRQIFEDVVRRNVDPGLVEMTEGNNFKTRVYPIPASGVRHLKIVVEKEIVPENQKAVSEIHSQTIGKDTYFYFYEPVDMEEKNVRRNLPEKITVLFDVSSSAKKRDIKKEIEFISSYAERIGKNLKIDFATFSSCIHETKTLSAGRSLKTELEKFIKDQCFDGATSFNFDLDKISSDEIILFSDGIENWNVSDSALFNSNVPVHTVNSAGSANHSKLKKIADRSKGLFINLTETDPAIAVEKLFSDPLRIIDVEFSQNEFSDVFPHKGVVVEKGFSVSGILKKKKGSVKISLGRNGKIEKVVEKTISAVGSKESDKVSRLWAMKKIDDLESEHDLNKNEILELSKRFTIVTKETSLIVLENISDYVRYGIVPPAELKDEYEKYIGRNTGIKKTSEGIPDHVYRNFNEVKKWWNKKPGEFIKKEKKKESDVSNLRGVGYEALDGMDMAMEMASEPASAPSMRMSESRSSSLNDAFMERKSKASGNGSSGSLPTISLQSWSSKSDYISILKKTAEEKMYAEYLELKKSYEKSPAFYMEVSDYFVEEGLEKESMRILSNLAELNLENTDVLRALGNKLMERKEYFLASTVFEKLTKIRSEVPQFFRDYALACSFCGENQKAVDALWHVASRDWDSRYSEIQQIALNEMNAIIAGSKKLDLSKIDKKLMQNFDVDVRIVLTWNTDDCDVDLWVTDPDGEKCYYGHKLTAAGGRMSRDFTQGYGPEEFMIKSAPEGKYKIEANYFGNHQQKILQPVIVQAEVYTNFGRENQKREVLTLQLDDIKQTFFIGEIEFK